MHASEIVTCSLLHSSDISSDRGPKQTLVTRNMHVLPAHAWLDHAWLQRAEVLARDSLTSKTYAREMITCSLATIAPSNSAALSGLDIAKRAAVSMLILEVANMRRIDAHCRPVSIQRSR